MPPRSFNGWVQWAMSELNYTLGDAEKLAEQRLLWQKQKQPAEREQDSLFEDSERADAQGGVVKATGGAPPSAPSKDSGRGTDGTREAGEDRPQASARPEYDPRSAPWPEDY